VLTQLQLDLIQKRHEARAGLDFWADGDECGDEIRADVQALLDDHERLANMVSDHWLLLDRLARSPDVHAQIRGAAEALLRKHKAPGWK
jgi:hypothetical protein